MLINKDYIKQIVKEVIFENYDELFNGANVLKSRTRVVPEKKECVLSEGLIKTYPTKKTIDYVYNYVGVDDLKFYCNTENELNDNDVIDIVTVIADSNNNNIALIRDNVIHAMEVCGYVLSTEYDVRENGKDETCWQFEPKYNDIQNVPMFSYLYHVSTYDKKEKIKANGLTPRSDSIHFKYPPRIYLFTDLKMADWYINYGGKNSKEYVDKELKKGNKFLIYQIGCSKLSKDIKFYRDGMMPFGTAIYTYDNIPPSAIVKCLDRSSGEFI